MTTSNSNPMKLRNIVIYYIDGGIHMKRIKVHGKNIIVFEENPSSKVLRKRDNPIKKIIRWVKKKK